MKKAVTLAAVLLPCLLTGCGSAPPTLYQWGDYQGQIYNMYSDPGKSPPEEQIAKLEEDYQKVRSSNNQVPPGFHAHLGYLYFKIGKADQALQELETEKALFPESTVYINRLLQQVRKIETANAK